MSSVPPAPQEFALPTYEVSLASVLPSLVASLEVCAAVASARGVADRARPIPLPPARSAVVVLIDGLGAEQLAARSAHAPFLRSMPSLAEPVVCGFPSTTATSMASFGTGMTPSRHGLVGWQVLQPGADRLLNHLSWDQGPDPLRWQPYRTVLQDAEQAGVDVVRVAPAYFEGSGLTRAALRGGRLAPASDLQEAVEATVSATRQDRPALVFLYWGGLDRAGHVAGPDTWEWLEELEQVDAALAQLGRRLPRGTSLTVTGDHGMLATPASARIDLAERPDLARGIRHLGGEPRGPQAYCEPGAAAQVLHTWRHELGERAWVLSKEEAIRAGLFGPSAEGVDPPVRERIGEVVALMRGVSTLLDSRTTRPEVLALVGHHGSLSTAECLVPLLHLPAT